ncbi:MAG: DUF58 domain-containing protein [Bryobacteraceae bacterium]
MRQQWNGFRQALERRIRYRVTRRGLWFLVALAATALGAVVAADNLLFLVLAAMLAAALVSGLLGSLSLAGLEVDFVAPEHVFAARGFPGQMHVRNVKWLMPSFSIRVEGIPDAGGARLESAVYFPLIPAAATLEKTVEARFARRGAYRENGFAFSTSFPFGFLRKTARVTLLRETLVYPPLDPLPGFEEMLPAIAEEMAAYYRGLGRDFYRIRPYEALESARHVDWKATAHTGALQVREFAREQERTVELFLDRDVPPILDDWFEHAVHCCGFLAWRLSAQGASVHFRSNGYSLRQPEDGDIYAILRYLALVYPQRSSVVEGPVEETSYKLAFTASPDRLRQAGWMEARILSPRDLPTPGVRAS